MRDSLVRSFSHAALSFDPDLAMGALLISQIEYPTLDVRPYLNQLDTHGREIEGMNFPGHFLLRCRARVELRDSEDLIIDAFHGGAILSEDACRVLLRRHEGDDTTLGRHLSVHASKRQILARMLVNLKRL